MLEMVQPMTNGSYVVCTYLSIRQRSPHTMADEIESVEMLEAERRGEMEKSAKIALSLLMVDNNVETDKWNAYHALYFLTRLVDEGKLPQEDLTITFKGKDVRIAAYALTCTKHFLNYKIAEKNPHAGFERSAKVVNLFGRWFGTYETARRAILAWEMSVSARMKGLPLPIDPMNLHIFFRDATSDIEQAAWAWKFVLMHIQDTVAACGSMDNASQRFEKFPKK